MKRVLQQIRETKETSLLFHGATVEQYHQLQKEINTTALYHKVESHVYLEGDIFLTLKQGS